jgi:hypothetical protein
MMIIVSQYVDACIDQLAHVFEPSEESWGLDESWVPTETESLN